MQIFISHFVFKWQPTEFFFSKKIHQINAGQYKLQSTNPDKILQSPDLVGVRCPIASAPAEDEAVSKLVLKGGP